MRYSIGREIGSGKFGKVCEATDALGNRYAVKLPNRNEKLASETLIDQYRFLSSVSHRRIVRVLDFDADPVSGPILVTELIEGLDLAAHVTANGMSGLVALTAMVLDTLRYLHSIGKVHGDLKPDSILVYEWAGGVDIKLVDGGFEYGKGSKLPMLVGTPRYLAPEVVRSLPGDGRSDLYSLGVVLYEVLTDTCPFGAREMKETLARQLEYVPTDPTGIKPDLAPAWDEFLGRLLKKEPGLRYQTAAEAGLELQRLFGDPRVFLDAIEPPVYAPLVGRERGMATLVSHLETSDARMAVIRGERNSGVSRILREVGCAAASRGWRTHFVALKEGMPAYVQMVEAIAGRQAPGSRSGARAGGGVQEITETDLEGFARAFQSGLVEGRRNLVLIDGGEVMDARQLIMLSTLARDLRDRVTIQVGYQPGGSAQAIDADMDTFEMVELKPLKEDEILKAVQMYFGLSALPSGFVEDLDDATRGSAGLLDATLKHLWSAGDIGFAAHDGVLGLAWNKTLAMPKSIREVAERKLDGLSQGALEVLKLMRIGAGRIEKSLLRAAAADGGADAAVEELLREGLIEYAEDETSVRLKWQSLTDLIRERTSPEVAKEMSRRLASAIQSLPAVEKDYYRRGLLRLEAGELEEAFEYLVRAGDEFSRYSSRDAILAYLKALECRPQAGDAAAIEEKTGDLEFIRDNLEKAAEHFERASSLRPSSRRKLAWVLTVQGKASEGVSMLEECRKAAAREGDQIEEAEVLSNLGYAYANQARNDMALRSLRKAKTIFRKSSMPLGLAIASMRTGIVEYRAGNFRRALRAHRDAKRFFEKAGDRRRAGVSLVNLGLCHWRQLDFKRADASFKDALSIFGELKLPYERAGCCQNYAVLLFERGELARARSLAMEALGVFRLVGRAPGVVGVTILLAGVSIETGNWIEAERRLSDLMKEPGGLSPYTRAMVVRYLGRSAAMRGDFDSALGMVDRSHAHAAEADDADGKGQAILERAKIHLRAGRGAEALEDAKQAQAILALSSSMIRANDARRVIGEALCLLGKPDAAIPEILGAMEGFADLPESLHMGRVHAALAHAYHLAGDHDSFGKYLGISIDLFRASGARYDYARAVLLGATEALARGHLLQARHFALEAARIFETLGIEDLSKKAVEVMEKIPSGDLEIRAITSLSEIARTLSSSRDLNTILNLAMDLALRYLGAERGVILLEDDATGDLTIFVHRGMDKESLEEVIGISKSIVESVRSTQESVIASDATRDPRFKDSKSVRTHNIMSVMCVPLKVGEDLVGIIYLDSRGVPSALSDLEKAFVDAFANQVALAAKNAQVFGRLSEDVIDLRVRAGERYSFPHIVGPGKKMQEVFRQIERAAKSDIRVLVLGENGTGKGLVAGLVHELSGRRDKPMVVVDLSEMTPDLMASELFGIEKRVATGVSPRMGYFERADGGTIFLDEIGNMPVDTQTKLLRFLDKYEFQRVGGTRVLKANVRVISATNMNLKEMIKHKQFRKDLYYRLNHMPIHLPPLRERHGDLLALVDYFVRMYAKKYSKPPMKVSKEVLDLFRAYPWPGNVRELETCIEHAIVNAPGGTIEVEHLRGEILDTMDWIKMKAAVGSVGRTPLPEAVRKVERMLILEALKESDGVKTAAARLLGIHEATLRKKMKQLGLDGDLPPAA
jgi:Nif-specific regulatory protein